METTRNIPKRPLLRSLCTLVSILFIASLTLGGASPSVVHAATERTTGVEVSIVNFAFMPPEITIIPGERVTWTNDDGAPHGLNYHDGAPGSDLLLPGESFSRRFDRPGIYDYNCSIHPYMTGRVVVRAK